MRTRLPVVLAVFSMTATAQVSFTNDIVVVQDPSGSITNLVAILLLSGLVVKLAKDYNAQRAAGKLPSFDAREYPEIRSRLEPGIWD